MVLVGTDAAIVKLGTMAVVWVVAVVVLAAVLHIVLRVRDPSGILLQASGLLKIFLERSLRRRIRRRRGSVKGPERLPKVRRHGGGGRERPKVHLLELARRPEAPGRLGRLHESDTVSGTAFRC